MDSMLARAWRALLRQHAGKVVVIERGIIKAVGHTIQEVLHYIDPDRSTVIQIPRHSDHHLNARDLVAIGWDLLQAFDDEAMDEDPQLGRPRAPPPAEPAAAMGRPLSVAAVHPHTRATFEQRMRDMDAELVNGEHQIYRYPSGRSYSLLDYAHGAPVEEPEPDAAVDAEDPRPPVPEGDQFRAFMASIGAELLPGTVGAYRLQNGELYSELDYKRGRPMPGSEPPVVPAEAPRAHATLPPESVNVDAQASKSPESPGGAPAELPPDQKLGSGPLFGALARDEGPLDQSPTIDSSPPVEPPAVVEDEPDAAEPTDKAGRHGHKGRR